jgi:hypothetical protein
MFRTTLFSNQIQPRPEIALESDAQNVTRMDNILQENSITTEQNQNY